MTAERPTNWQPPRKEIGGENNFELCAIRLYDQIVAMMAVKTGNFELPISSGADEFLKEKERIIESMKQKGVYFYEDEGSVFMDYKIMREKASANQGWESIESQFSPDMSTEEAMELARSIVANWDWAGEG